MINIIYTPASQRSKLDSDPSKKKYNLKSDRLKIKSGNFHKWEFEPIGFERKKGMKITGFQKKPCAYETTLYFRGSDAQRAALIDELHSFFEQDISLVQTGLLEWGGWSIDCYIRTSSTYPDGDETVNDIEIYCPYPYWSFTTEQGFEKVETGEEVDPYDPVITNYDTTLYYGRIYDVTYGLLSGSIRGVKKGAVLVPKNGNKVRIIEKRIVDGWEEDYNSTSFSSDPVMVTGESSSVMIEALNPNEGHKIGDEFPLSDFATFTYQEPRPDVFADGDMLDYNYDYDYDYKGLENGKRTWEVNYFLPAEFELTIDGAVTNPRIVINGHVYQVYTTLTGSERLVINSKDLTITKYSGTAKINQFDLQNKESDIFKPIEAGNISVVWSNTFNFTLKLFIEASEPKWSTL